MDCEYYYVSEPYRYFKYTRSLEYFHNDELFKTININPLVFDKFLEEKKKNKNIIKILYFVYDTTEVEKIIKLSVSLPSNIKIFVVSFSDWWHNENYPSSLEFFIKNVFYYDNIRYIVCTDYKTLGSFLNINMEKYKKNIISWDMHNCYDKCIIPINNNPINKILISGNISNLGYPERYQLLKFNNVEKKEMSETKWTSEDEYAKYLNNYICCFSSSVYPINLTTNTNSNTHLILLKTYEILGSGSLLLMPLTEKSYLENIGLFDNVNCMLINMEDDKKIQEKLDYIINPNNRELIDRIRIAGQNHGKNNLNSKVKYEMLRKLIIDSE